MLPSATRPDVAGTGLMAVAGVCWGLYSLVGRKADDRVAANAHSFLGAMPFAVVMSALTIRGVRTSAGGLALGIVAGAVTSGLGYAIWYRALGGLTATQAAIVQLSVPVIAALGAVAFLDERLTARLVVSGVVVLGGVALALTGPKR
jgi:drug/metabolite transporter (DMT)-like permease